MKALLLTTLLASLPPSKPVDEPSAARTEAVTLVRSLAEGKRHTLDLHSLSADVQRVLRDELLEALEFDPAFSTEVARYSGFSTLLSLGRLGPDLKRTQAFLGGLQGAAVEIRLLSARGLSEAPEALRQDVVLALTAALDDPVAVVARGAAQSLARYGTLAKGALPRLRQLLSVGGENADPSIDPLPYRDDTGFASTIVLAEARIRGSIDGGDFADYAALVGPRRVGAAMAMAKVAIDPTTALGGATQVRGSDRPDQAIAVVFELQALRGTIELLSEIVRQKEVDLPKRKALLRSLGVLSVRRDCGEATRESTTVALLRAAEDADPEIRELSRSILNAMDE